MEKKGDENEEKSTGKGGKGGSRMESSSRKTRILQMGKVQGRVHPKLKHILSESQHALRVPAARGRIF